MFIPKGYNRFKKSPKSSGILGSVISQAKKLKEIDLLDKPKEIYNICPGCNRNTCFYIGASPTDVECVNRKCKFYKEYTDEKRYYYGWEKPYEGE